jgi:hypothetical protein
MSIALCLLPLVTSPHHSLNVSAYVKVAFDLRTQRFARLHKVLKNDIHNVFVEDLNVPKRVDIEFQTLEFNAALVRNIVEFYGCEIREVRKGTDGSELRDFEADLYLAPRKLVGERIERVKLHFLARRGADIKGLLVNNRLRFTWRHNILELASDLNRGAAHTAIMTSTVVLP